MCGDLGFSVLEPFAARFPERFVNAGVAEQNMTGVAAGIALCGDTAVTYSIANFPTLRCLEQIRNDVCYHRLDVKIVAVGGGFAYGPAGFSHHGLEDLAVARALPNITVLAPGDPIEAKFATRWMMEHRGPCYLRLGRAGETRVHSSSVDIRPGEVVHVRDGSDGLLITTGGVLGEALQAADAAADQGLSVAVWSCPWLKPLDEGSVREAFLQFNLIVSVEEGSVCGGLGSAIAEVGSALGGPTARHIRLGVPDIVLTEAFSQHGGRVRSGIDAGSLARRLVAELSDERTR